MVVVDRLTSNEDPELATSPTAEQLIMSVQKR